MKKLISIVFAVLITTGLNAQADLGEAPGDVTVNHNQRLIVRDSGEGKFVAYPGYQDNIEGVMYNDSIGDWSEQFIITEGKCPTLTISDNNQIHLIYETLDELTQIKYRSSWDFINWSDDIILSDTNFRCSIPIADVDSSNTLNVFWIQDNTDNTQSLIYARCNDGVLVERKTVLTKNEINDLAMANHLQYYTDNLFFASHFNQDSIQFYKSYNHLQSIETVYSTKGSFPCITYNSGSFYNPDENCVRMLYINTDSELIEVETDEENTVMEEGQIPVDNPECIWVDDIAPPIGYSFLYAKDEELVHEFSYGAEWSWNTTLETLDYDEAAYASIAYKHFNFYYVDFIFNDGNSLLYLRDEKHIWTTTNEDKEPDKGFTIIGSPNPFSKFITLKINIEDAQLVPEVLIYNTKMELIRTFESEKSSNSQYSFQWNGSNTLGENVSPGIYIIICSVGDKRTARKILYQP